MTIRFSKNPNSFRLGLLNTRWGACVRWPFIKVNEILADKIWHRTILNYGRANTLRHRSNLCVWRWLCRFSHKICFDCINQFYWLVFYVSVEKGLCLFNQHYTLLCKHGTAHSDFASILTNSLNDHSTIHVCVHCRKKFCMFFLSCVFIFHLAVLKWPLYFFIVFCIILMSLHDFFVRFFFSLPLRDIYIGALERLRCWPKTNRTYSLSLPLSLRSL